MCRIINHLNLKSVILHMFLLSVGVEAEILMGDIARIVELLRAVVWKDAMYLNQQVKI